MNAIILAAGLGSRFKEVTKYKHKALLEIDGVPNLERTINYLLEANINEINIVVGYLAETFEYLTEKYPGINIIKNNKYREYNNLYTFSKALPYFSDTFVIDADTVLNHNIFINPKETCYFTILRDEVGTEWLPVTDDNNRVISIEVSDEKRYSLSGVSYWKKQDCDLIKKRYKNYLTIDIFKDEKLYWDNIPINMLGELRIVEKRLPENSIFEMDTVDNYNNIKNILSR